MKLLVFMIFVFNSLAIYSPFSSADSDAVMVNHNIMHTACRRGNHIHPNQSKIPDVLCTFDIGEKLQVVSKITKEIWKLAPYNLKDHEINKNNYGYAHISEIVQYQDATMEEIPQEETLVILSY